MHPLWRAFHRWFLDHHVGLVDLLALAVACVLTCGLILSTGLAPWVLDFAHKHPALRLESLLVCLSITWAFLAIFAWRRWQDVARLQGVAETDALTGLDNRRKLRRELVHEFDRALRYGRPLSLVMFDIDHFKRVNDTFGHPMGDQVLKAVARRVKRKMRVSDHLGRWGGEEFMLVCPETDLAGATLIAERMRRSIKQRRMSKVGHVTASFGVCTYRGEPDLDALLEQVDHFLYLAKQDGRDRVANAWTQVRTIIAPD